MNLPLVAALTLAALALLVEPVFADIRPPDYPFDGERSTAGMVATVIAGLSLTAALAAVGYWLVRRDKAADQETTRSETSIP
ncbi:MAG: hypothetical protein JNM56_32700 [Planctomycetia bacterium]|nr:hypothetical protein [Planctomycetia bacterium]